MFHVKPRGCREPTAPPVLARQELERSALAAVSPIDWSFDESGQARRWDTCVHGIRARSHELQDIEGTRRGSSMIHVKPSDGRRRLNDVFSSSRRLTTPLRLRRDRFRGTTIKVGHRSVVVYERRPEWQVLRTDKTRRDRKRAPVHRPGCFT